VRRDRVSAEVPYPVAAWLAANASPETWERVARDLAVLVGRRLLLNDGEAGWEAGAFDRLSTDPSPAVRTIAAALGCSGARWTAHRVADAVCEFFGLYSARRVTYDRLLDDCRVLQTAPTARESG